MRRRRRLRRDERAQVSAVAVVLGLLLVVSFIATYALGPLPDQEAQNEFQHQLLVENQLDRLSAVVLAQTRAPDPRAMMVSPLTLGSQAVPPFGPPARGDLQFAPNGTGADWNNLVGSSTYYPPNWGNGSICANHNGNGCSWLPANYCRPPLSDNFSASGRSFSYTFVGSNLCAAVNLTGDHNVYNIYYVGSTTWFNVTLYGNDDFVNVFLNGSHWISNYDIYGRSNVVNLTYIGSYNFMNVNFTGENRPNQFCPYQNLSSTDGWKVSSVGRHDTANLTWYNQVGYSSGPTFTNMPGGGRFNTERWQNVSGPGSCAFYKTHTLYFPDLGYGGLSVTLQNDYSPVALLGLEDGGVFLGSSDGDSVVIDPPPLDFYTTTAGNMVRIGVLSFVGPPLDEQGFQTAGIGTQVLSVTEFNFTIGGNPLGFVGEPTLNLSTRFPQAWDQILTSTPRGFFSGAVRCTAAPAIQSRCMTPPPGATVLLSVPLNVVAYQVTYIEVQVTLF